MGKFITAPSRIEQLPEKNMYRLIDNELYLDDDSSIYLTWRNFKTDNFTWLKSNRWDIRCSHLHDVGCRHHQILKVKLTYLQMLKAKYIRIHNGKTICENIPLKHLEIVNVSFNEINNMFYRMLKCADCPVTPKYIQYLYRAGVQFNLNWWLQKHDGITPSLIYVLY